MALEKGEGIGSDVQRIIGGLPGAVIFLSSDEFQVKYTNGAYRHFLPLRFRDHDLSGLKFAELVSGGEKNPLLDTLRTVSETKQKVEKRGLRTNNEDGDEFWVDWSALPIDNGTEKSDILVSIIDVTERKQAQMLSEALNQVNAYINSTLDYDEIMQGVLKEGAKALDAESSLINMREGDHWVARFVHNFPSNILGQVRTDEESPTSMMVIKEGKAVAIDDALEDPRVDRQSMKSFNVRSLLVAPIVFRKDVMGVIAFYYHSRKLDFTDTQIDFANKLTASLSQAINNARNYQDAKSAEDRVRRQNAVLEGINRIFHQSIVTDNEEDLGLVCLNVVEKITQSRFGFIGQMNSKGLLDDDAISDPGWEACRITAPMGHGRLPTSMKVTGLYGRVITEGKGFFTNDPNFHPDSTGVPKGHPPLTSFLGVPLKHAGKVIGMIGLGNKEGGYSERDLNAAEAMAPAIVEALKRKKAEESLMESEAKYRGLFENMQEAVTIRQYVYDEAGRVVDKMLVDANPAALRVLGVSTIDEVLGLRENELLSPSVLAGMLEETEMMESEGRPLIKESHYEGNGRDYLTIIVPLGKDQVIYTSIDITERKQAELEQETTAEFLRLVNDSVGTKDLIHKATSFFQKHSGVEAVGIRIRDGADYPYYEARGFPQRFVQLENALCARDERGCPLLDEQGEPIMECTCGSLIRGIFNPSKPYYTKLGSFWTNSTTELGPTMAEEDLPPRHRNRCVGEGYESIALIPLFLGKERLGLLQLNDHRRGIFSAKQIAQWERLAGYLAVAVSKFRIEEELMESEAKYRGLFESMQEVVALRRLVYDDQGEIVDRVLVDTNPAGLKVLGVSSMAEVKGWKDSENLSPEMFARRLEVTKRMKATGKPVTEEIYYDSNDRYYLTTFIPLGNDHVFNTSVDVTETKRAQRAMAENFEAARQRAEEVERLMDIIPSAIWVAHDPECSIITGNRAADRFYESDPGENVSAGTVSGGDQDMTRRFYRDGRELMPEELPMQEAASKGISVINSELEVLTPSGKRLTILGSASPLRNPEGKVRGAIAAFVDITSRKNQERELEISKGRLEAIIGQMPVGIIVTESKTGKILVANEEIQRIYKIGFNLTDIQGFDDYRMITRYHLDGRPYEISEYPFVRSLMGEVIKNDLAEMIMTDGSEVFISSSSAPVYDSRGTIVASVALSIDVTEQVRTQRERDRLVAELERHSNKLRRSNTELQQFAYVASHDLQEPLRMVTAYLSLLDKRYGDQLEGQAKEYMSYAMEGGMRARDLVRDLLEISRVESQAKQMTITDMNRVLEKVCDNLAIQIKDENATIVSDPLPEVVADDAQMIVLLQNLISNAIKFHGVEDPTVKVSCDDLGDQWQFSVKDNGIGIDPQFKDKIFVIFQRLHSRVEYEGTGIGLAIAKKIVERHGGRIWFESQMGQGTTFCFTIPKGGKA